MSEISEKLLLKEFEQTREDIRAREVAMNQLLNLAVVGTTALISGITAFLFNSGLKGALAPEFCYLFLLPLLLIPFSLAGLSNHRDDLWRMGIYVQIFIEERFGGAEWHIGLAGFRKKMRGESQDPAVWVLWVLFVSASVLFAVTLEQANPPLFYLQLWSLLPFLIIMLRQHFRFMRDRSDFEQVWREILQEQIASNNDLSSLKTTSTTPSLACLKRKPLADEFTVCRLIMCAGFLVFLVNLKRQRHAGPKQRL